MIRIGCRGCNYAWWCESSDPDGLVAVRRLEYYASVFDAVEVN